MRRTAGLALSLVSGYIALSYELLWYRVYFISKGALAASFPLMLGVYLLGVALGSLWAERYCARHAAPGPGHARALTAIVASAYLVAFVSIPLYARSCGSVDPLGRWPWLALCAGALGALLPLLAHFTVPPDDRSGARLAHLYVANIVGSAAGTLLTGFWLMDVWSLPQLAVLLTLLGLLAAAALLPLCRLGRKPLLLAVSALLLVGASVVLARPALYDRLYERLQEGRAFRPDTRYAHILENRSGVITISSDGVVTGSGTYDGRVNLRLDADSNGIRRAYALAGLHPAPRRVLLIGVSMGSWAQVIAHHPAVEQLTAVDINPGYLALIPRFPEVASLVSNPKVRLVVDDGRRWLERNPDERFDFVVGNMPLHWTAGSSHLLSREFQELVRRHLAPGGVYLYNSTRSGRAKRTSALVFRYTRLVDNCVAGSDAPLAFDRQRFRRVVADYTIDGRRMLDPHSPVGRAAIETALEKNLALFDEDERLTLRRTQGLEPITDDNLGYDFDDAL